MYKSRLESEGYILFENPLTSDAKNRALSCIKEIRGEEYIDYTQFKKFIDQDFLGFINKQLEWNSVYEKFRFSNKSNSRDASTFHTDIYNYSNEPYMPIYTCLIYFDNAVLEIIPGSHLRTNKDTTNELYDKRTQLNIKGGSILVFNANMYHRGIFYNSGIHERKLLQVFDVYPNQEIMNHYKHKYLKVNTNSSGNMSVINDLSEITSKSKFLNEFVNYLHFWLVRNDIQYKFHTFDNSEGCEYIGYIPGRLGHIEDKPQPWNINIHLDRNVKIVESSTNYLLIIKLLCIIIVIVYTIVYTIKNRKRIATVIVNNYENGKSQIYNKDTPTQHTQ
jgi:hypothetical protein